MATQIEANSLSDITHVAGNPPKYPRNPTEIKRDSLTLYIARVPGTRDIILTTLKPQLKNVTASDVANSLYYLHLNTTEDARLVETEHNGRSDAESIVSIQKPLQRKPLPDSARSSLDLNRQSAPPLARLDSNSSLPPKRKPVASNDTPPKPLDRPTSKPPLSRRPLGPRPQLSTSQVERKPLANFDHSADNSNLINSRNASPARANVETERSATSTSPTHHHILGDPRSHDLAFTVTIIRRDPSTASQWNVGTVSGHPIPESHDRPKATPHQAKKAFYEMSVHLTNPGYAPFKNSYLTSQMDSMSISPTSPQQVVGNETAFKEQPKLEHGFHRQIRMEGTDFWTRSFGQHKRSKSDVPPSPGITRGRSFSGSAEINPSEAIPTTKATSSDSNAQGYMFLSPWNGRCKFQTSSSGRSLRCRHTLPNPVSARQDDEDAHPGHSSKIVSEIRFNLPSAALFNSMADTFSKLSEGDSHRRSVQALDHIRNKFSSLKSPTQQPPRPTYGFNDSNYGNDEELAPPLPRRPHRQSFTDTSDDDAPNSARNSKNRQSRDYNAQEDKESRFDLSLGQEKAGGGNRGKRAKLGKLIIHDEGFKFLDLLVASNMAVWWSVWEADF